MSATVIKRASSAVADAASNINFGKVTNSTLDTATSAAKKVDFGQIANSTFSAATSGKTFKKISKMGKKSGKELVSEINGFASHPGMRSKLGKVTSAMANNPKIAAAGITAAAAAGYVAFRMAEGATFEEALGELVDAATTVATKVVSSAAGVGGGVLNETLEKMFGENYMMYVKALGVLWVLLMLLKLKKVFF